MTVNEMIQVLSLHNGDRNVYLKDVYMNNINSIISEDITSDNDGDILINIR